MHGWCDKCRAVAFDGICSEHGSTKPLGFINAIDVRPLTEFEKELLNRKQNKLKLDDGIFLTYGDKYYRRKIVFLDRVLLEFKFSKNDVQVIPHSKGLIKGMDKQNLLATNRERLERLIRVSKDFAEYEYNENGYKNILSFSGGKDSIALANLLKDQHMTKVFIDTKIEFPETYSIINKFKHNGGKLEIVNAENSFFPLCKENGFPTYENRWCCKTQKFKPFDDYLKNNYEEEYVRVFTGQRRWESIARYDSPFVKQHKHITKQLSVQPLLEWLTMDVWNYVWANNLPVNELYKNFDRAGCWTCPFGLKYRSYIMKQTHPKMFEILKKFKAISEEDIPCGIENGKPCETEINGKIEKTCDVFGHHYIKGMCRRCGKKSMSM